MGFPMRTTSLRTFGGRGTIRRARAKRPSLVVVVTRLDLQGRKSQLGGALTSDGSFPDIRARASSILFLSSLSSLSSADFREREAILDLFRASALAVSDLSFENLLRKS